MAARMKSRIFWDVAPCSHVEVDRRLERAYCLHHQGEEFPEDSKINIVYPTSVLEI
jgi:hypothetical protein